jgi:hypothetical protein
MMNSPILKSILLLLSTAFMITLNGLANGLPLNGKTTGELSAQYPNWFVPAGVTFSIWGVLYLLMFAYVGMRIYKSRDESDGIEGYYMLTAMLNGSWIVAWHYEWMAVSLLIMGGLLASLVVINEQVRRWADQAHWLTKITFGMYFGWILVATVANVTAALVDWGWSGFGIDGQLWAAVLVVVATGLALWTKRLFGNTYILVPVAWALLGILIRHVDADAAMVVYPTAIGLGVIINEMTRTFRRKA